MKELPVIITSQGDAKSERWALQMQADDFISKPYNPDIIRHRVENVLASRRLRRLQETVAASEENGDGQSTVAQAFTAVKKLKPYFDIVRLVEPGHTLVYQDNSATECELHACYAVWGKAARCADCSSLKALGDKGRHCKLEYANGGLYFVISAYVPFGKEGAVIEMVTKLDDAYTNRMIDRKRLSSAAKDEPPLPRVDSAPAPADSNTLGKKIL